MVRTYILSLLLLASTGALAQDDPTAPLDWMTGKTSTQPKRIYYNVPALQSIVCEDGANTCRAVLNDKIVSKGESVSGYRVSDISRENVTLTRGSKTWNLELFTQIKH